MHRMSAHIGKMYTCCRCGRRFRVLRHVGDELYEARVEGYGLAGSYIFPDGRFCTGFCVREFNETNPQRAYRR